MVPMAVAGAIWVLQDPARERARGSQRKHVDGDLSLTVCVRRRVASQSAFAESLWRSNITKTESAALQPKLPKALYRRWSRGDCDSFSEFGL